jgi:RNA polymerase primary sigma factor
MRDSTGQLLDEIGRYRLLTADEEITLSRQVQEWMAVRYSEEPKHRRIVRNGKRAFDRMTTANLRMVVYVAKKYVGRCQSLELNDLIQLGSIGLVRAVEKFDHTRGYKFSTYAYWWIRQSISRGIEDSDRAIRLPAHQCERMGVLIRFLNSRRHDPPSAAEVKAELGLSHNQYTALVNAPVTISSLDIRLADDRDSLLDLITNEEPDEENHLRALDVKDCVNRLPDPKYRDIIIRRYGLDGNAPCSLQLLGNHYGISRERIRQIQTKAENQLRLLLRQQAVA